MPIINELKHLSLKRDYCNRCGHIEKLGTVYARDHNTGKFKYIGPFVKNKKGVLKKITYFQILKFLIKNR